MVALKRLKVLYGNQQESVTTAADSALSMIFPVFFLLSTFSSVYIEFSDISLFQEVQTGLSHNENSLRSWILFGQHSGNSACFSRRYVIFVLSICVTIFFTVGSHKTITSLRRMHCLKWINFNFLTVYLYIKVSFYTIYKHEKQLLYQK